MNKKRILLGIGIISMLLTSCSDEVFETSSDKSKQLKFSTFVGKRTMSKATEVTETALQDDNNGISIFAYRSKDGTTYTHYFDDVLKYNSTASPAAWELVNNRYVQQDTAYQFYATYPKSAVTNLDRTSGTKFTYTVTAGATQNVDLLGDKQTIASADTSTGSTTNQIDFLLNHLLCQVNFGVHLTTALGSVVITNIQLNNVGSKGTYNLDATTLGIGQNNWTMDLTTPYSNFPYTNAVINTDATTNGGYTSSSLRTVANDNYILDDVTFSKMIIPAINSATENKGTLTFTFQAFDPTGISIGTYNGTIDLTATQWNEGLRYIYLVDFDDWFNRRKLTFTVDVNNWENYDWGSTSGSGTGIVDITY